MNRRCDVGVYGAQAGKETPEEHAALVAEFCQDWRKMWRDHFRAVYFRLALLLAGAYVGVIVLCLWIARL